MWRIVDSVFEEDSKWVMKSAFYMGRLLNGDTSMEAVKSIIQNITEILGELSQRGSSGEYRKKSC